MDSPMECSPPGCVVHGDSPGKNTGVGCYALLLGDLPNPGIKPRSPAWQADSLPSEPLGKLTVGPRPIFFQVWSLNHLFPTYSRPFL